MTVLTDRRGQDVTRIFTLRDSTIVTTDTIVADTHMIVAGTHPGDRIVTVIAGIRTHDMRGIFAPCDNAVVTALTTSNHGDVINPKYIGPNGRQVTNLAFAYDPYVLAGRGAGIYATGQRMASGALCRCADENPLYVAGFTTHHGMCEIQRKSHVVMIEIRTNLKRSGATCIKPAQHQQSRQSKAKAQQPLTGYHFIIFGFHIFTATRMFFCPAIS